MGFRQRSKPFVELHRQGFRTPGGTGRLQHDRGNVPVFFQQTGDPVEIRRDEFDRVQHALGDACRDGFVEGDHRALPHPVVPSAEMALETQHFRLAGVCTGDAECEHASFGPRVHEPYAFSTRDQPLDQFGPFHLHRVVVAEMEAEVEGVVHGPAHLRRRMTQQQRGVAHAVVDVFPSVLVPLP